MSATAVLEKPRYIKISRLRDKFKESLIEILDKKRPNLETINDHFYPSVITEIVPINCSYGEFIVYTNRIAFLDKLEKIKNMTIPSHWKKYFA